MALSNTAVPKYYGMFRDAVIRGEIPVNKEISMEMNRIDDLIANPGVYYDDRAVEGFIDYCESELTLTDGADLNLLDTFKLWAEQIFGWYYFVERSVYEPYEDGYGGHYITKKVRKRLINKQYLIVARGAAKSMYGSCLQNFFSQCGRNHNAPDYYGSDNETGRRGFVSDSHLNHSCKRPILQILDRGVFTEYDRL